MSTSGGVGEPHTTKIRFRASWEVEKKELLVASLFLAAMSGATRPPKLEKLIQNEVEACTSMWPFSMEPWRSFFRVQVSPPRDAQSTWDQARNDKEREFLLVA